MKLSKKVTKVMLSGLVLVMCTCFVGCSNNESKEEKTNSDFQYMNKLPSPFTEDDAPVICVNKLNLEIIDGVTMDTGFTFHVLTKSPLDDNSLQMDIDIDTKYELIRSDPIECSGKFEDYICLQYNNMDWNYLKELELRANSEGASNVPGYEKMIKDIDTEYEKLNKDAFPHFYDNEFYCQFDPSKENMNKNESFSTINLTINGESYTVDIGNVYFNYTKKYPQSSEFGDYDLQFDEIGRADYGISYNKDGIIGLDDYEMTANKDVKIKNIKIVNQSDEFSLDEVNFTITSDDIVMDQQWKKGEEIAIPAGSDIFVDFKIKDTEFISQPNYAVNVYLILEYEVDGAEYIADTQACCNTRYDSNMLYAMYKDKIDMISYFNDYLQIEG